MITGGGHGTDYLTFTFVLQTTFRNIEFTGFAGLLILIDIGIRKLTRVLVYIRIRDMSHKALYICASALQILLPRQRQTVHLVPHSA